MRILSLILFCSLFYFIQQKDSNPHGKDFKLSCSICHSPKGWTLDKEIYSFDHNTTKLPLSGQHTIVSCKSCHPTLIFADAKTECNECHTDIHQGSVGQDCARCHSTISWLVSDINEVHQYSRFPLLGAHRTADCSDCHRSESLVRFDVAGVNCIDCHREDFLATSNPNHTDAGFSEDCSVCHPVNSNQWSGAGFNHNFFPLVQGHSGLVCAECHIPGNYSGAKPECNTCHQKDYDATTSPNHSAMGFPLTCSTCHSLEPGWKPASFTEHDNQSFPIYSGRHKGVWTSCTECHPNSSNYSEFTCILCHEHNKASMDSRHNDVGGYSYNSTACLHCHPSGVAGD
jgi:hypothetical protein